MLGYGILISEAEFHPVMMRLVVQTLLWLAAMGAILFLAGGE